MVVFIYFVDYMVLEKLLLMNLLLNFQDLDTKCSFYEFLTTKKFQIICKFDKSLNFDLFIV
jgi:hypothetical protein